MGIHSYLGGIFFKFMAIILMFTGFFLLLYSSHVSQQTGTPIQLYWIASWIIFIVGLVVFATGVIAQRRALRRMKSQMRDGSRLELRHPHATSVEEGELFDFLRSNGAGKTRAIQIHECKETCKSCLRRISE